MSTSVHRKRTHTDRYLNFHSHHHHKVLSGVVKCLRNRALRICDSNNLSEEIQHLHRTFQSNSFPDKMLNHILNNRPTNISQSSQPVTLTRPEEKKILCLPYVRGLTENIDRVCRNIKSVNVKLISRTHRTIRQTLVTVSYTHLTLPTKRIV